MPTTFKYKFYAMNEVPPSWLTNGEHDVTKAMLPVVGGISSAMTAILAARRLG